MGEMFTVMKRMVEEWSEEDDSLIISSRLKCLTGEIKSLSLKTEGYQWFKSNQVKADRIIRINPKGKYTVSESPEFQLGSVTNLWAVATQSDESGKPLKELAKIRIANRELPGSETFDEYIAMRSSCWILEERDGDFFCDCPICMKVVFYTCIFCVYKLIS